MDEETDPKEAIMTLKKQILASLEDTEVRESKKVFLTNRQVNSQLKYLSPLQ